ILCEKLATRRIVRWLWGVPTRTLEQCPGRAVDIVFPWGEHAHMAPLAYRSAGAGSGFEHDRLQPAFQGVCGGCETHRSATDDGDPLRAVVSHWSRSWQITDGYFVRAGTGCAGQAESAQHSATRNSIRLCITS